MDNNLGGKIPKIGRQLLLNLGWTVGVFDMPNPNRYDILAISIF